jgi:hypothetical protein
MVWHQRQRKGKSPRYAVKTVTPRRATTWIAQSRPYLATDSGIRNTSGARLRVLLLLLAVLQLALVLLVGVLGIAADDEAVADAHVGLGLGHQGIADVLLRAPHPGVEALLAERVERLVQRVAEELGHLRARVAHDVVDVGLEFLAEGVEREIVDVFAEGVLDFAADGGNTEDDVGGEDAAGDGHPVEVVPHLERKHHDIDPGDLGDGDGVGDGERGVENAVDTDKDIVEGHDGGDCC